ncbi:MAG: glycoside hydrolase family 2 [Bacteroidales bacterium]|nr:glycoside hydrolase family 2 [Bacteroidales bacterium]MCM1147156.1 glycoside hydrolase family 2 [Bacteroidales bacterium]MCM1205382.1 glycoside hydrolase family 2 [Bacillota bacterium]MCM1509813.1 hypothetical protein [Clostridium sp.]
MKKRISLILLFTAMTFLTGAAQQVWNFNLDWRFHRGEAKGAEAVGYDDSSWEVVSTPHTVQLMPAEDSGCRNYQGVAWYRKRFIMPAAQYANGKVTLQFEAIMGKQDIYVNGKLVKEHLGGYLPVTIDLTAAGVKAGDECLIAVMTDNSDDKSYPPGKKQMTLDFCYHGGIYRDVWLTEQPAVHITDAVEKGEVAGGGIFVHYANISEKSAEVYVNTDIENSLDKPQTVTVTNTLLDAAGNKIKAWTTKLTVPAKGSKTVKQGSKIAKPNLWSPEKPYLYTMRTQVLTNKEVEKRDTKIGIRSFEFKGKDGFWLNGKRYRQFIGANRHQDFAYVGNAVPNSQQRRDVQRLKDCGFNLIRVAHYPQDPAFMDACDELGIFIIVATPGWQYWNKAPEFADRVHQNTRDIIRRDRNHPCVLMWEPILNETRYPEEFALEALKITKDEYPYPYRPVAAADLHSAGVLENYDVVYAWPGDDEKTEGLELKAQQLNKNMLTREFGELVDDWYAHNNLNRASRSWGEIPQLKQALSLSNTTRDQHRTTGLFLGGCQWHPFDHQRGYHPDPYWGGNFDAFRQPKTAYHMFHSQIPATEGEPMVYIAHEMTQFSENDVVVFSNCDSVRLSIFDGEKSWTLPVEKYDETSRPYNAPVVFRNVWDFFEAREYSYKQRNWQKVNLVAEGIIGGKVVATMKKMPSRRSTKLRLYADERDRKLVADGSDFIVVVCEVTDDSGNVRRLAKDMVKFSIEGPAEIIGDGTDIGANPRQVEWGSAPILLRSTTTPGKIKVHADVLYPGTHSPTPCDLEIESVPADCKFVRGLGIDGTAATKISGSSSSSNSAAKQISEEEKQRMLQEVQDQQADFGVAK